MERIVDDIEMIESNMSNFMRNYQIIDKLGEGERRPDL